MLPDPLHRRAAGGQRPAGVEVQRGAGGPRVGPQPAAVRRPQQESQHHHPGAHDQGKDERLVEDELRAGLVLAAGGV